MLRELRESRGEGLLPSHGECLSRKVCGVKRLLMSPEIEVFLEIWSEGIEKGTDGAI